MFDLEKGYSEAGYEPEEILEHHKSDMPELMRSIRSQAEKMNGQFLPKGKVGACIAYIQNR